MNRNNLIIKYADQDNVGTAVTDLEPGAVIQDELVCIEPVMNGHKIALCKIPCGSKIIKYGICIAVATADIEAGSHVHIHNAESLVDKRSSGFSDDAVPQDMDYSLPEVKHI